MIKKEIKDFKLTLGDYTELGVTLPASVFSTLKKLGYNTQTSAKSAKYHTYIHLDSISEARRYVLRLRGIVGKATLLMNGAAIAERRNNGTSLFDISGAVLPGENLLEIIFSGESSDIPSAGIWGRAELLSFGGAIIEEIHVTERFVGDTVNVEVVCDLYGSGENMRAVATLVSSAGHVYYAGLTRGRGNIVVKEPLFWWPRGLGLQSLYKLTVNLYGEAEIEDTEEIKIGLRQITTANNADGQTLEVGGVEFLPMGAVYEPAHEPSPESLKAHIEWVVSSAYRAGFNTLVIPKDTYLPEEFYNLCDVSGIVVIHELSELSDAARELIKTAGRHASFGPVDIIGGEEIYEFSESLREIIPELDFAQYEEREEYPKALSLPTEKTLLSYVPEGERNIFSPKVESLLGEHTISILGDISDKYLYPKDLSEISYVSNLIAAERIKKSILNKRLNRGNSGRAVFNNIFSANTAVSYSSIDSLSRWKALQYYAAKFFAPTLVYAENEGACVGFSISNERRLAFIGEIEYKLLDAKNNIIEKGVEEVAITEMSARKVFTKDFSEKLLGHENEYYLEYSLREGTSIIYKDTLLFSREKEFKYENPEIKYELVGDERRFAITLSAKAFARGVEIDLDGVDAILTDNFFDLTSSAPVKISFNTPSSKKSASELSELVKIRSVYDVGR